LGTHAARHYGQNGRRMERPARRARRRINYCATITTKV
jgi:hypothetical protein